MFTLTDEFARAQYDYTTERLRSNARPRRDVPGGRRHRGRLAALFHRDPRHRLRPSAPRI